jgi:putative transposase
MPRQARSIIGGYPYHVLNRANGRLRLFKKKADFEAFEQVLLEAQERVPLRILAYAVMGNHWHFVVWPKRGQGEEVSNFFRWLTHTHSQRWHAHHGTAGRGHVYQGRFKSFPVSSDEHLTTVMRYVERNPLRAEKVERAEQWRWGSLSRRIDADPERRALLTESPVPFGDQWVEYVNQPQTESELLALSQCVTRGRPFGNEAWCKRVTNKMGLEHTYRSPGRPRKKPSSDEG